MRPLLLTFDLEEFDWPAERGRRAAPGAQVRVTTAGLRRVLPVLADRGVRATFFATARYAEARPEVVRELIGAGHEVAAHGLEHRDAYAGLPPEALRERLARAREVLAQVTGRPPVGFRAPRLQYVPASVLAGAGYGYDASLHPTYVPGRYNGLHWSRTPWVEGSVVRVPISVLPGLRVPLSWLWFRWWGATLTGWAARHGLGTTPYCQVYFHPWEAVPVAECGIPWYFSRGTGARFVEALARFLDVVLPAHRAVPVADWVAAWRSQRRSSAPREGYGGR